jgi:branched-chain amino acid transport system permease protein
MDPSVIFNGIFIGAVFAVATIGLSFFYTTTGVFNFAHGALLMIGGYLTYTALVHLHLPLLPAALLSIVVVGLLMTLFYRYAILPIRTQHITSIIVTLALLLMLERLITVLYGPWGLPFPTFLRGAVFLAGIEVPLQKVWVAVSSLVAIFLLWVLISRTWIGLGIRATIDNEVVAESLGIDAGKMHLVSVFLSSAITAFGGINIASTLFLSPVLMSQMNVVAITVSILAGLGSIWGVVPAAFILGFADAIGANLFGGWFRFISMTTVVILTLIVRPRGIFGQKERVV